MKLLALLLVCVSVGWGQGRWSYQPWGEPKGHWVTDSTVWHITSIDLVGDSACAHDWVEGDFTTAHPGWGCLVDHHGGHCSWTDAVKSRICRKCQRKETLRESTYEHWIDAPRTEYEILKEKMEPPKSERDVDSTWLNTMTLSSDTAAISMRWAIDTMPVVMRGPILLTLESLCAYWQEYSDSCAVDSTWYEGWGMVVDSTTMIELADGSRDYAAKIVKRNSWLRTPRKPDCPGFMAFLRRRVR